MLADAGELMFRGYNALSSLARDMGRARYSMRPKHHLMWHAHLDALRTRRNPAHQWTFKDEDGMGKMGKLSAKVHGMTTGKRTLQRWLIQFFDT